MPEGFLKPGSEDAEASPLTDWNKMLPEGEAPWSDYDELPATEVLARIERLTPANRLRVFSYESGRERPRKRVLAATRVEEEETTSTSNDPVPDKPVQDWITPTR